MSVKMMRKSRDSTSITDKIIGLSISDLDEYAKSDLTHVDYIGVGPIYPTPSKHDAHIPVGPKMIATFKINESATTDCSYWRYQY